jgi:cyanophycin synthetase
MIEWTHEAKMILVITCVFMMIIIILYDLLKSIRKRSFINIKNDKRIGKMMKCKEFNSSQVYELSRNKDKTKEILKKNKLPIAKSIIINSNILHDQENAKTHIKNAFVENNIKYPVVIKPINGQCGNGIITSIMNETMLIYALNKNAKNDIDIMIEEQHDGIVYRLLFVNGNFVGGLARNIPYITGDGVNSVEELIMKKNTKQTKDNKLEINDNYIKMQGYDRKSILENGKKIKITNLLNFTGESYNNVLKCDIHDDNIEILEQFIRKELKGECLGFDIISKDISKPFKTNDAIILEINSNPDRKIHSDVDDKFIDKYQTQLNNLINDKIIH